MRLGLPVLLFMGLSGLLLLSPERIEERYFAVCAPESSDPNPAGLLYSPGYILVQVNGSRLQQIEGFEVRSRPHLSYDGSRLLFAGVRRGDAISQIWELNVDETVPRQLTSFDYDSLTPHYLPDGRIAFAGKLSPGSQVSADSALYILDEQGEARRISFGDSLDLIESILEDGRILVRRSDPKNQKSIELALRPDGTELALYSASRSAPRDAELVQKQKSVEIHDSLPGYTVRHLIPVEPRPLPPVATSLVDPELDFGWVLCLDVRRSDLGVDLDNASRVRAVDARTGEIVAGGAIESDGSFFLQVPADRLFQLELLDPQGGSLARQQSGIWVRPNEHHGCIGCHEPRYLSPENRMPLALRSSPAAGTNLLSQAKPLEGEAP